MGLVNKETYLHWHYSYVLPRLFQFWQNLLLWPFYHFEVGLHLRTFWAPFHRQVIVKAKPGFDLTDRINVFTFNTISRLVGAILRGAVILTGLIISFFFLMSGWLPAVLWAVLPGFSLPLFLLEEAQREKEVAFYLTQSSGVLRNLLSLLLGAKIGRFVVLRLDINPKDFVSLLPADYPIDFLGRPKTFPELFGKLAELEILGPAMEKNNLKPEDFREAAAWYEYNRKPETPFLLSLSRIKNARGVGVDWSYGYTVLLDKYSTNLISKPARFPLLIGRDKELGAIERVLVKTQANNVLIIGEPGVARHALVESLANRILTGECQPLISHRRVVMMDMHAVVSARPSLLEVKGLFADIAAEAEAAGNLVLVIDEIDKYLSSGEGRVDLTDVIVKLANLGGTLGIIGITSPQPYHKYIEPNSSLAALFEKLEVSEPPFPVLLAELLISVVPVLEKKYKVLITLGAVKRALTNSDRYVSETPFPAKAIELLDGGIAYAVTLKKQKTIAAADIDEFLTEKLKIPVGRMAVVEKEKLGNLEALLHQKIIGQHEAIKAISSALRRARLAVSSENRPLGAFLFLGPTGVGKTETAKALSEVYFGKEQKILRFDMSQYQKEEGLERLIGSVRLGTAGELTSALRDCPFSLLLLDEFEKSDRRIFNLFLTLIDEGYIGDSLGRRVGAKNAMIIATSNAGAEFVRQSVKKGLTGQELKNEVIEYVQREGIFSPELLNRFDAVVIYQPQSKDELKEVAGLMLKDLNRRLADRGVAVVVTEELLEKLSEVGFDPQFGARAMRRAIAEKVEDQVARALLSGQLIKGQEIEIKI